MSGASLAGGGGDVEHRHAGDATPRLLGRAGRGLGRDRLHPRHPHPAQRRHGHLRYRRALGAFLAGAIGVGFGRLTWAGAVEALRQTIKTSALIFMILIGATVFGYYMAMSQIPQHVVAVVTEMNLNRWVVMVGIVVVYFVVSMFMIALVLTTMLVMVFPALALWLPNTMR